VKNVTRVCAAGLTTPGAGGPCDEKVESSGPAVTKPTDPHLSEDEAVRADYAQLVRAAAAGVPDDMERLLMRAQEVAYRFSLLVCGQPEDAEDVMQDALMKTFRYVSRIQEPEAFRTWLYKTVRNACLMKRRRRVGEPSHHLSIEQGGVSDDGESSAITVPDSGRPADQQLMDAWIGERLRRALHALSPAYRAIVVLRDVEGLSTREVASVTNLSEANVRTRLHRARLLMRQQLEEAVTT
jgi:RNA polymerase sigma-70 factor, ECF subfamily